MINTHPINKRDPRLPMIMKDIGGMTYAIPLFDSESHFHILPSAVFDYNDVGKL